jgi:hypothetical protein
MADTVGTYVEAEPSEPNQGGTNEDHGDIVRLCVILLAVQLPLPENKSVRKSRAATCDVDRTTTSVVEGWKIKEPAICVPRPASNRAITNPAVSLVQ